MPFPWKKKSRVARISRRLVADLQSPRKHGGSLVVETGFPTSLVDLVVKNRNRLRKTANKKKQDEDQGCWEISDPILTSPLPPHLVCPEACADLVEFESRGSGCIDGGIEASEEEVRKSEADDVAECGEDSGSGRNDVFVNIFRVFVVLVLGFSSRRFTAGVTLSAVLLLLLEFVGKWVFGSVTLRSYARACFEPLIDRVSDFFGIPCLSGKKCENGQSLDAAEVRVSLKGEEDAERDVEFSDCSLSDKTGETDGSVLADEELIIRANLDLFDLHTRSKRDGYLDFVSKCEDHKHDQNVKQRSKFIQKIVPKKLKHPKAGKKNTASIATSCEVRQVVENDFGRVEHKVQVPTAKEQSAKWSVDKKTNDEKMTNNDVAGIVNDVVFVTKPVDGARERMALTTTFTMILAALIGGRVLAIVLTTGYFGSKFIRAVMT